jgi:hypothetical protein
MKDKKGGAKIIAQSVCNLADNVYPPEKGKQVFEQKVNLKFHKALNFANLLKPHAALHLQIKSSLSTGRPTILAIDEMDLCSGFTPRTDFKTVDNRKYLTNAGESLVFDADQSLNLDGGTPLLI